MFNTGNCPSVPIVANLDGNNGNNWNDGSWLWFLIVVFAIFGGWGNGFGGFGGTNGGVGSEIQRGFDNSAVISKLDGISNGLCDGFYAMNNSMLTGFNGINTNIMQTGYGIQQAVNADTVANMQNTKPKSYKAVDGIFPNGYGTVRKDDVGRITDFDRLFLTEPNFEYAKEAFRNRTERRIADKLKEIEELKVELKIINESEV